MYHAEYDEYDDMSREEWLEYRQEKKLEKREVEVERQKKMITQRLLGIGMLLMSVLIFIVASHAQVRGGLRRDSVVHHGSTRIDPFVLERLLHSIGGIYESI